MSYDGIVYRAAGNIERRYTGGEIEEVRGPARAPITGGAIEGYRFSSEGQDFFVPVQSVVYVWKGRPNS